jgi:hypothetical protein
VFDAEKHKRETMKVQQILNNKVLHNAEHS